MVSRGSFLTALVFGLGWLSLAIAGWIHLAAINEWAIVFAHFGAIFVVTATLAAVERSRGPLPALVVLLALWLPGIVVLVWLFTQPELARRYAYPLAGPGQQVAWYATAFGVPMAYPLGRMERTELRWMLSLALGLVVLGGTAYYTLSRGPLATAQPFLATAFITALATWTAIPLYYLGVATGNRAPTVPGRPATVLGAAVGGTLVFYVLAFRAALFPLDASRALVFCILAGPVVFLVLRRLHLVFTRTGRSP